MRILFVDAGNYCRSPAAEAVARALAAGRKHGRHLSFSSAGLKDKHVGEGADPRTIAALHARGYALPGFRCREIGPRDFTESALILAMDRENLAELDKRRPSASVVPIELFLGTREVPDPYFGGPEGFEAMLDLIEVGVAELLDRLLNQTTRNSSA